MAGSGYNIPISVSVADSFSVPQSQNLPDYIIFGNAGKTGGDITANPQSYAPATAVSSAAEGNAASNFNCPTVESFPAEPFARRVSSRVAVFSSGQLLR